MLSDSVLKTDKYRKECMKNAIPEFLRFNIVEIVLIGGAAVLANYGFRDMTYDIDAIIQASSSMKDAINKVSDEMGLPKCERYYSES